MGVNIRTVSNPITAVDMQRIHSHREVVTDVSSEDRDPNGRRESQDQEPDKNPLNDEEMKRAREYLDGLSGLKANGLRIEVESVGDKRVFLIKDEHDNVVRRILEWEMRGLIDDSDKKVGQIFDRAA